MPLFTTGAQYPPQSDIERLAKYARGRKIFDGKQYEVFERASELLKDTPHATQLEKLYIAVNLMDVLLTKPADLMVGEPPTFESGQPDDTIEQKRTNSIVEENDLVQLIHETVIGAGYRGDSYWKTYFSYRHDYSELESVPDGVKPEPIIESVNPSYIFPEFASGSVKRVKAINIAYVEWVDVGTTEIPFLVVERHIPGQIQYSRFKLYQNGVDSQYGFPISTYKISDQVATGKEEDVVYTGLNRIPIHHIPYKSTDDDYYGISGIEKIDSVLAAIQDTLCSLDYILHKHSDPTAYGPDIGEGDVRMSGKYLPIDKNDVTPGYMTFLSSQQLDGIFRELDILLSLVFQMSETPQWLFGTIVAGNGGKGGEGTSHTDGAAIKARFMPILSKVKRIRVHVDRAVRDALWTAMELENYANDGVDGFNQYEPVYPKVAWKDGIPANEKEQAEIMQIRTGGRATIDVKTAVKRMDELDDNQAEQIIARIQEDAKAESFVDPSIFNSEEADE